MSSKSSSKLLAVVILNYGAPHRTLALVDSFQKLNSSLELPIHCIVVDNFSSTDTQKKLRDSLSDRTDATFLALDSNRGYGAGNNAGLKLAFEGIGARWALVLNPDVEVIKFDLALVKQQLVEVAEYFTFAVLQGDKRLGLFRFHFLHSAVPMEVPQGGGHLPAYVSGCCWGVSKAAWERYGGFAEDLFLYYEEIDFIFQQHRRFGCFPRFKKIKGAEFKHDAQGTHQKSATNESLVCRFFSARSRVVVSSRIGFTELFVAVVGNSLRVCFYAASGRFSAAKACLQGTGSGLAQVLSIEE